MSEGLIFSINRITEWLGLEGTSGVTQSHPLLKQGHPEQAAQDRVQAGLEDLQRRRLHSLPGQPGPGLHHPQREEVLPHLQLELPLLQFVPVAPCPRRSRNPVTLQAARMGLHGADQLQNQRYNTGGGWNNSQHHLN